MWIGRFKDPVLILAPNKLIYLASSKKMFWYELSRRQINQSVSKTRTKTVDGGAMPNLVRNTECNWGAIMQILQPSGIVCLHFMHFDLPTNIHGNTID